MATESVPHTSFEISTGRGRTLSGFSGRVPFEDARKALDRAQERLDVAGLDRETSVVVRVGGTKEEFTSLRLAVDGLRRIQTEFVGMGQPFGVPESPKGSKSDLVRER